MKKIYQAPKTLSIDLQVEGVFALSDGQNLKIDTYENHAGSSTLSEKKDHSTETGGE